METISDLASKCIRCGFCLESCPTFGITGEETESPRGRIYLIRLADAGLIDWKETRTHVDRCLGCRACETACPSGVEYGKLLELARAKLGTPRAQQFLLYGLTRPKLLKFALRASRGVPAWLAKWLSSPRKGPLHAARPATVHPTADRSSGPPVGARGSVMLLEGCVMRELYPNVHAATRRLIAHVGYGVEAEDLGCCGALEAHAGMLDSGVERAKRVQALAKGRPIVVNSAGCGSWLKDQAVPNVFDLSEFLLAQGLKDKLVKGEFAAHVTYHDACHLAHAQRVREAPRELLCAIPGLELIEMAESDRCCGSAGIYNLTQPDYAQKLVREKWDNIQATGARIVVQGNPGCHTWLEQNAQGTRVAHLAEILDGALQAVPY